MRSLGILALALSATGLAAAAPAAVDSRATAGAVPLDTPVQPDARSAPSAGAWTNDGWSDDARAPALAPAGTRPEGPSLARPRAVDWRDDGPEASRGPHDGWRRQTWDGGRGDAFRYRRGSRLPRAFADPIYVVSDWEGYDLAPPGPGRTWVRYYDDAVLIDRGGIVQDAVPAIGWTHRRPVMAQDDAGYYYQGRDPRWHDDAVSRGEGECSGGGAAPRTCVYAAADGGRTIVTTTPAVVTTTTTTTERYVTRARPRAKARVVRR